MPAEPEEAAPIATLFTAIRRGARGLWSAPGFSVTVVLTLALGIGVMVAVFGLVSAVLIRPLPHPEANRLVALGHAASRVELAMTGLSAGTFLHYRAYNSVFEEIGVYVEHFFTVTDQDEPEQVRMAMASPSFFSVLRVVPALGRLPTAADFDVGAPAGLFISYDFWRRRYGADTAIVGRTIEIEGDRHLVVGVAEPGFHFPHPETQAWMVWPLEMLPASSRASVRSLYMSGVARLKTGVSLHEAERDLQRLVRSLPDAFPDVNLQQLEEMGLRATVVPLKDAIVGNARVALLLLMAAAAFLLLITWVNVTNVALVRAEGLRREVSVEQALGATSGHLLARFMSESFLLATLAAVLGLMIASGVFEVRFGFEPEQIPRLREVGVDKGVIGLTLGLSLFSGVLLACLSLVSTTGRRQDLARVLMGAIGRMTAGRREQAGRRILIAVQLALALTLLIGCALMVESFRRMNQVALGFRSEGAFTFHLPLPPTVYGNYHASARVHDDIMRRLRALPGVQAVEAVSISGFPLTPVPSYWKARVAVTERLAQHAEVWPYALFSFATPGYFQTMGIPLLQGRDFRTGDMSREAPGVILSAALAQTLFGRDDPVGGRVRWATSRRHPGYTVVGVVGDVLSETIRDGPSKVIYFPNVYPPLADSVTGVILDYIPSDEVYVVRASVPAISLVPTMRRATREVDSRLVITRIATLEEVIAGSMARTRLTMLLLTISAAAALLLGMISIYGILSYTVSQRTPELGVRIALGAAPASVVWMIVRQGSVLALAGVALGLLTASALMRFLQSVLYEISPSNPLAFTAMAALLLAVAVAASYVPARRAARIDPVRALRGE